MILDILLKKILQYVKILDEVNIMERLKQLRKELKQTQTQIANYLGISVSAYGNYELGQREPDHATLSKLADYFGVSVDYLLGRSEESTKTIFDLHPDIHPVKKHRVPMLGEIACGQPIYANEDRESYVEVGTDLNVDFCLTARGDSMIGARIKNGDIVFCVAQDIVDNGEIAAVIIGDEATLKRVYYYPEKQKLVLQAENPKYEPFVYVGEELNQIRIIGKAVAFQSDIE